jgi:DNA helicase HerA-like ATPase
MGNRVQHALRAFTPRDQKAVKAAASTMRSNPELDVETAIVELAVGEALVSFLDEKGRPSVTQRVFVIPPGSQIGSITPAQRQALVAGSLVAGAYEKTVDRESAHENLKRRAADAPTAAPAGRTMDDAAPSAPGGGWLGDAAGGLLRGSGRKDSVLETIAKSAARSIGSTVGREIIRGVLGSLLGRGTSRRR